MNNKIYILVAVLGIVVILGLRAGGTDRVTELFDRDAESNVFQEIKILKQKNEDLKKEIQDLELNIKQLSNRNLALEAIQTEIEKYKKLKGDDAVFGNGIAIEIQGALPTSWFVDFVNELFASGAQGVSVNGIRISNTTAGFDMLPQGQILLNGSILSAPYVFEAIGDYAVLAGTMEMPGGILSRLKAVYPSLEIEMERREVIQMK
ncbi:DUF881 domain-containing protein [Candidatus Peregrinibacteria bacterium]|nr:DUF881 domain-containing protein [Candidatus Peregrinibacteria bacterium]